MELLMELLMELPMGLPIELPMKFLMELPIELLIELPMEFLMDLPSDHLNNPPKDLYRNPKEPEISQAGLNKRVTCFYEYRPVIPGGAKGATMAPSDFGRSGNPYLSQGGRLFSPNNNGTPGLLDLPTAPE